MEKENESYKRPVPVMLGWKFLRAAEHVMPSSLHNSLCGVMIQVYRRVVHLFYYRRLVFGSQESRRRANAVVKVMPHSLVGWQGLEVTYDSVVRVCSEKIDGCLVECGVAQGGSALLMAIASRENGGDKHLWLFDSYEGLPDPTEQDFKDDRTGNHFRPLPKGSCLGTIDQVRGLLLDENKIPSSLVHFVKGWFQDTLPLEGEKVEKISVLRLDGDWYESTKCCLEHLFDKVSEEGIIILDDYYSCFGCRRAVDEFLEERDVDFTINADGRGGAWFKKTTENSNL